MGFEIKDQSGKVYGLFARQIEDAEGNKHQKVMFIEQGKEKEGDKELSEVPKSAFHPKLKADRGITLSDNEALPIWARLKFTLSEQDKLDLLKIEAEKEEAKEKEDEAKQRKHDKKVASEAVDSFRAELIAGKHPEAIAEIVKANPLDAMTALSKLKK